MRSGAICMELVLELSLWGEREREREGAELLFMIFVGVRTLWLRAAISCHMKPPFIVHIHHAKRGSRTNCVLRCANAQLWLSLDSNLSPPPGG